MILLVLLLGLAIGVVMVRRGARPEASTPAPRPSASAYPGGDPSGSWRTAAALGRFEAREFLRHPAFVFGVVITPLMLTLAGTGENQWSRLSVGLVLGIVPLAWMTIIAANLIALRPRRYGADELISALPAGRTTPTLAVIVAGLVPALLATAMLGAAVAQISLSRDMVGSPLLLELAPAFLIAFGATVVGVAVARWLPSAVWGIAAVVVTAVLETNVADSEVSPSRFLAFLGPPESNGDPALQIRPAEWHVVYLVALVAFMVGVALARDGVRRRVAAVLVSAALVGSVAGWAQVRPASSKRLDAMADRLITPEGHQVCEQHGAVEYCAYPEFEELIAEWRDPVERALAVAPAAVRARGLVVRQRPETVRGNGDCAAKPFRSLVRKGLATRIEPSRVWEADGLVHPGYSWPDRSPCGGDVVDGLWVAVQTGAWAVGLPPAPGYPYVQCTADGQARAVLALWLGAQSSAGATRGLERLVEAAEATGTTHLAFLSNHPEWAWDSPPMWGVRFHAADAAAALALLERPEDEVADVMASDFIRYSDPGTPAAELLAAAGVTDASGALPARDSETCA